MCLFIVVVHSGISFPSLCMVMSFGKCFGRTLFGKSACDLWTDSFVLGLAQLNPR